MERTGVSVAAIDIGSNSVRLLIMSESGDELHRDAIVTALGRGMEATSRFRDDTIDATLDVMRRYSDAIDSHDVSRVGAVATSASRDASNGAQLMDAIAEIIGSSPEIITGEREAELSFAGATASAVGEPPYLVIDIGGGSTEFVYGTTGPTYALSVDIGSVRLTDRLLPDRPPTAIQRSEASAHVDAAFSTVRLPGTPGTVIGVAGTFTSLAAISLGLERHDRDVVHGHALSRIRTKELITELSGLTVAETAAIPSLDPRRAPVILAGAVIADRATLLTGLEDITVSEHDLLDGLAFSLVADG